MFFLTANLAGEVFSQIILDFHYVLSLKQFSIDCLLLLLIFFRFHMGILFLKILIIKL